MTVSTSVGRQFTVGEIVAMAYKRASLLHLSQTPGTAEMTYGRDQLELIIDDLETYGVMTRAIEFVEVTTVDGTSAYDLPEDIVDVLDPAKYIAAGQTDPPSSETRVQLIGFVQWQEISSRTAEGDPTMFYIHKQTEPFEARLWPTPDEAGTLRFMVQRKFADVDTDAATVDLPGYWTEYLVCQLAAQLAESATLPAEKVVRLMGTAKSKLLMARAKSNQGLPTFFAVDHPVRTR